MSISDEAYKVALDSLRRCFNSHGIVAGRTHFESHWARDSFYASWGALETRDYAIVRKNLEFFMNNINEKGVVPIRIGCSTTSQNLAFFGIRRKPDKKPYFSQDKGYNYAMDPNSLLIITLERYVSKTGDLGIVKKNIKKIHEAIDFLESHEKEGLIYAGKYATWQDMIKKEGAVLYTNVLYYQALVSLSILLEKIGLKSEFLEKAKVVKEKINEKFWNKKLGHYNDFFNEKKTSTVFSSDGNFFAALFGVSDQKQSLSILKKAEKFGIAKDVPSYTNYPRYGFGEAYTPFYLLGMQDYNDYGVSWTWLGCLHSMALAKTGKKKEAKEVLEKLASCIVKDKEVYEVYEKNGKPLKRLFYKSEHPFAWTAGFYILAHNELKR